MKLSKRLCGVGARIAQHVIHHRPAGVFKPRHVVLDAFDNDVLSLVRLRNLMRFEFGGVERLRFPVRRVSIDTVIHGCDRQRRCRRIFNDAVVIRVRTDASSR